MMVGCQDSYCQKIGKGIGKLLNVLPPYPSPVSLAFAHVPISL